MVGIRHWRPRRTCDERRRPGLGFTDTHGGFRNLRVIRPGYAADTREILIKEIKQIMASLLPQGPNADGFPSWEWQVIQALAAIVIRQDKKCSNPAARQPTTSEANSKADRGQG